MDAKLGGSCREILIFFLRFDQLLLQLCHLPFCFGKALAVFWPTLAQLAHTFFCNRQFLFQIAVLGQQGLHPLLGFFCSFHLGQRFISFVCENGDLLVRVGEFCVGLVSLFFRGYTRLFSSSDCIFQASDVSTQLFLLLGTIVPRCFERFQRILCVHELIAQLALGFFRVLDFALCFLKLGTCLLQSSVDEFLFFPRGLQIAT